MCALGSGTLEPCLPLCLQLRFPMCLSPWNLLPHTSTLFRSLEAGGGVLTSLFPMRVQGSGGVLLEPCLLVVSLVPRQLSSSCHPVVYVISQLPLGFSACCLVVFHLSPRCGLPVVSPRCLPDAVFQMLSPSCRQGFLSCCPLVFHLSPTCGLQLPSNCLPQVPFVSQNWSSNCLPVSFVTPLFPSCLSDVVSYLSPSCLAFVLQMWSSNCLPVCSRCALPILSQSSSIVLPQRSVVSQVSPPIISRLLSKRFRAASQMWSSISLKSLSIEFEAVNADGLQSWVHGCLSVSSFISLASGVGLSGCLLFSLSPLVATSCSCFITPFVSSCCLRSYTSIDSR